MRTVTASNARAEFNTLLDDAEAGKVTLVVRHSKLCAMFVPVPEWNAYLMFRKAAVTMEALRIARGEKS